MPHYSTARSSTLRSSQLALNCSMILFFGPGPTFELFLAIYRVVDVIEFFEIDDVLDVVLCSEAGNQLVSMLRRAVRGYLSHRCTERERLAAMYTHCAPMGGRDPSTPAAFTQDDKKGETDKNEKRSGILRLRSLRLRMTEEAARASAMSRATGCYPHPPHRCALRRPFGRAQGRLSPATKRARYRTAAFASE